MWAVFTLLMYSQHSNYCEYNMATRAVFYTWIHRLDIWDMFKAITGTNVITVFLAVFRNMNWRNS